MPRIRLSFTERRRRRLALKVDRLDRLESRSTVTPFSAFSLASGAFQGLAQLGLMQGNASAQSGPLRHGAETQGGAAQRQAGHPQARGPSNAFLPIRIAPPPAGGGGGGATAAPDPAVPMQVKAPAGDRLTAALAPASESSSSAGITSPGSR